ncbi:hypothetical protein BCR32DRAFT_286633 [Anaeromyces robustus]|uniref:Uncharacterized protein n=1 Tax=Anaeromyces robustus TaxID=1754192 RepID=A0A1Y1VV49_9FUNG|nr:hypothetical protein BCR32DRAFT_286633 [Anaeromyces robustus]|eukprot:ORX65168.1 hypothetical protein BCR32DRAFT_286633 [Anaeromyces robustus]
MSWEDFENNNKKMIDHISNQFENKYYINYLFKEFKNKKFKDIRLILINDIPLNNLYETKAKQNIIKEFYTNIRLRPDFNLIEYLSNNIKAVYVLLGYKIYKANNFIVEIKNNVIEHSFLNIKYFRNKSKLNVFTRTGSDENLIEKFLFNEQFDIN